MIQGQNNNSASFFLFSDMTFILVYEIDMLYINLLKFL